MNRIMAKLAATSETVVALIVMVMNLQKLLGVHFLRYFRGIMSFLMAINGRYSLLKPKLQRLGDWCIEARFALPLSCF
jgi:hypothetical protein